MGGLAGKRRAIELTHADKAEAFGATTVSVSRAGSLPLGRTVRATGCGAGALTTQQSVLPFGVGEAGVCLQQPCCWGMGAARQTITGAMTRSISTVLTARRCADLTIAEGILQQKFDHSSVITVTKTRAIRTRPYFKAFFLGIGAVSS